MTGLEYRPLICRGCGDTIYDTTDHDEGEAHCFNEDDGSIAGTLKWDWSYNWRDDDPSLP